MYRPRLALVLAVLVVGFGCRESPSSKRSATADKPGKPAVDNFDAAGPAGGPSPKLELVFDSELANAESNAKYHVRATVPLVFGASRATSPLGWVSFEQTADTGFGIVKSAGTADGTFTVLGAELVDAKPVLTIDPGDPTDITTGPAGNTNGHWWRFYWAGSHPDETAPDADVHHGPWIIVGWTDVGDGVRRKTYRKAEGDATACGTHLHCGATETTTLELRPL